MGFPPCGPRASPGPHWRSALAISTRCSAVRAHTCRRACVTCAPARPRGVRRRVSPTQPTCSARRCARRGQPRPRAAGAGACARQRLQRGQALHPGGERLGFRRARFVAADPCVLRRARAVDLGVLAVADGRLFDVRPERDHVLHLCVREGGRLCACAPARARAFACVRVNVRARVCRARSCAGTSNGERKWLTWNARGFFETNSVFSCRCDGRTRAVHATTRIHRLVWSLAAVRHACMRVRSVRHPLHPC
jgi:hypothetical protein